MLARINYCIVDVVLAWETWDFACGNDLCDLQSNRLYRSHKLGNF